MAAGTKLCSELELQLEPAYISCIAIYTGVSFPTTGAVAYGCWRAEQAERSSGATVRV